MTLYKANRIQVNENCMYILADEFLVSIIEELPIKLNQIGDKYWG